MGWFRASLINIRLTRKNMIGRETSIFSAESLMKKSVIILNHGVSYINSKRAHSMGWFWASLINIRLTRKRYDRERNFNLFFHRTIHEKKCYNIESWNIIH